MHVSEPFLPIVIALGTLLLLVGMAVMVRRAVQEIRSGKNSNDNTFNLSEMFIKGAPELIFAFLGFVLLIVAVKSPHVVVRRGLHVDLCDNTLLTIQRADGGINNSAKIFIMALNMLPDSDKIDERVKNALAQSLTYGELRKAVRDETIRTFLPSEEIDVWCRVSRKELETEKLSPGQQRMYDRVDELFKIKMGLANN